MLGWISLGFGIAGLAMPGEVARGIGVRDDDNTRDVVRMWGARELMSGLGILSGNRPTGWVWSRVAGDVMDLALLGSALGREDTEKEKVAIATAAVLGITAVDVYCGQQLSVNEQTYPEGTPKKHAIRATAVTIYRPIEEIYAFWRSLENLPRFMHNLEEVREKDSRRSLWRAKAPAGLSVEWEAEILEDRPNELISWRSLPGSQVQHSGHVSFRKAPGRDATEVRVELEYAPPGGNIGKNVARMFGKEPGIEIKEDLRRLKQVLETGDQVVSDGRYRQNIPQFPQHAAQPPSDGQLAAR